MSELTQEQRDAIKADSENGFGANVGDTQRLLSDYTRLEQECANVREKRDSFQLAGILAIKERDAAIKQANGLRDLLLEISKSERRGVDWAAEIDAALSAKP